MQLNNVKAPIRQQYLALDEIIIMFVKVNIDRHEPKSKKLTESPSDVCFL